MQDVGSGYEMDGRDIRVGDVFYSQIISRFERLTNQVDDVLAN